MILPSHRRLTGLIAAAFTPLHRDGSLNLDRIPDLVDQLEADGVAGLYVLGTTGEGASLSAEERFAVAEAFVAAAHGRLKTVVQVGHNSVAESRTFAQHAQEIGADAISAMPPSYFKPEGLTSLVHTLAEIAAGAPRLPFYYYHIPAMTGVQVDLEEFLTRGAEQLPTLAGIKFSDPRLHELQAAQRFRDGAFDIVFGVDEMLLGAAAFGIRGAVGSTYNFAAPLYLRMLDHLERGELEEAARWQARSGEMLRVIQREGGRSGLKAVMGLVGIECGPSRLPQETPSREKVEGMRRALEAIGFFQWGRQRDSPGHSRASGN